MPNILRTEARILITALFIVGVWTVVQGMRGYLPIFDNNLNQIIIGSLIVIVTIIIIRYFKIKRL